MSFFTRINKSLSRVFMSPSDSQRGRGIRVPPLDVQLKFEGQKFTVNKMDQCGQRDDIYESWDSETGIET